MPRQCPLYSPNMVDVEYSEKFMIGMLSAQRKEPYSGSRTAKILLRTTTIQLKNSDATCEYDSQRVTCGGFNCPKGLTPEQQLQYFLKNFVESAKIIYHDRDAIAVKPDEKNLIKMNELIERGIVSPLDVFKLLQKMIDNVSLTNPSYEPPKIEPDDLSLIKNIKKELKKKKLT